MPDATMLTLPQIRGGTDGRGILTSAAGSLRSSSCLRLECCCLRLGPATPGGATSPSSGGAGVWSKTLTMTLGFTDQPNCGRPPGVPGPSTPGAVSSGPSLLSLLHPPLFMASILHALVGEPDQRETQSPCLFFFFFNMWIFSLCLKRVC